jgi:MFS family permease
MAYSDHPPTRLVGAGHPGGQGPEPTTADGDPGGSRRNRCGAGRHTTTLALHISIATVPAAALLLGLTWAFLHSSPQTWATSVLPHARGTVVSLFATLLLAGSSFAASAAAPLADHGRWSLLFALTSTVTLVLTIATVLGYRAYRQTQRSDHPTGPITANANA